MRLDVTTMSHVLFEKRGNLGLATLNRTSALNSLNTEMICSLINQFESWLSDPSISFIVLQGSGDKGFCAGGDVKSLVQELKKNPTSSYANVFFKNEYR